LVEKSALGRFALGYTRPTGPDEDALFVAVLVRAAELLREHYPGIAFHLLMWGDPPPAVIGGLESAGIELHYVEAILEAAGLSDNAAYIGHDGHPTAAAHAAVADYVGALSRAARTPPGADRRCPIGGFCNIWGQSDLTYSQ
jgi:hypothetical protein